MKKDLNIDLGEGFGHYPDATDTRLLAHATSCNIACGFHAGDPTLMRQTVRIARDTDTLVGAHPSYPDLRGFGRTPMDLPTDRVIDDVLYQVGALSAMCRLEGVVLNHVKPHGALYNRLYTDESLAYGLARALFNFDPTLVLYVQYNSAAHRVCANLGIKHAVEVFSDRRYADDGNLLSRSIPGAVLEDFESFAEQVNRLFERGEIRTISDRTLQVTFDTLCLHQDHPQVLKMAAYLRERIDR